MSNNLTKQKRKEFCNALIEMRVQLEFAFNASISARRRLRDDLKLSTPDFFALVMAFTSEAAREIVKAQKGGEGWDVGREKERL